MLQVEVGEVGSQQHAQRERMLRSAIELQAQLKLSQQKLETLCQQLAETSVPEAQAAHSSADAAEADSHNGKGKPDDAAAAIQQKSAALMESLFGSDDDVDAAVGDGQSAQAKKISAGGQQADSAASVAQPRRQTTAGAAQAAHAAGTADVADCRPDTHANQGSLPIARASPGISSHRAQHSTTAGPSQRLVDPAAPRRSISFSNSLRRRQASSIQQRRDAFNAAADAAAMQAVAQRSIAGSQAADSSQAAAKPEADEARQGLPDTISHKPLLGAKAGVDMPQVVRLDSSLDTAVVPEAISVMPSALPPQDLPGGRIQSAAAPASPAMAGGLMTQSPEEVAPKAIITRTSQAEAAPKLKTGSRLAASMAKLAASKRAPNDPPTPEATPARQSGDGKKKGAIPDDVRQALLAKVCWMVTFIHISQLAVNYSTLFSLLCLLLLYRFPCKPVVLHCLTFHRVQLLSHLSSLAPRCCLHCCCCATLECRCMLHCMPANCCLFVISTCSQAYQMGLVLLCCLQTADRAVVACMTFSC